jgi:hypothetical protein
MQNTMQKRILVLKTADSRYFEEAHLILKENPAEQAEDDSMVAEANRILQNARNLRIYPKKRRVPSPLALRMKWFFLGCATTIGIVFFTSMLYSLLF